jgi:diguanylate cyclase (GGDEF)-like protein
MIDLWYRSAGACAVAAEMSWYRSAGACAVAAEMFFDDKKKQETDREMLFQKRIAELGFQRAQLPWNMGEKPVFDLPVEETKFYAERELEDANLSDEEIERRVLMELLSQTTNFKSFYKRLHYEVKRARRYKRLLSVVLVGVDRLESIAYQAGIDGGDALRCSTARILLSCIRDVDVPGRCREDTFGVILPETGIDGAEVAAERIRTKLENHSIEHNWKKVNMTVSIGVSCFPNCAQSLDELFAQAAEALLTGMQRGGNTVVYAPQKSVPPQVS